MTHFEYQPRGVCSRSISLDLDGDRVRNVKFVGGCDGNLKAVASLVDGLTADEVMEKLSGIRCGVKGTSCGDQLAKAVQAAVKKGENAL